MNPFKFIYTFTLILILIACQQSELDDEFDPRADKTSNSSSGWSFSTAANYTYDNSLIDISNGQASIKTVDLSHSSTDFNNGTKIGVELDANNNLTLSSRDSTSLHVNNIFTSKSANLKGYWRLENNGNDSSGNGLNLTAFSGSTYSTDAKIGNYTYSYGSGQSGLYTTNAAHIASNLTISLWVNQSSFQNYTRLFAKGMDSSTYDFRLMSDNVDSYQFSLRNTSGGWCGLGFDVKLTNNTWHHLVFTFDGTNIRGYQDAVQISSGSCSNPIRNSGSNLILGSNFNGHSSFRGSIDEVALWEDTLSADEVKTLYEAQLQEYTGLASNWTPSFSNIAAYWKLDTNWQDSSGNNNHGTAYNGATFTSDAKLGNAAAVFNEDVSFDYVQIPNSSSLENIQESDFTIQVWHKPAAYPQNVNNKTVYHALVAKPGYHTGIQFRHNGVYSMRVVDSTDTAFSCLSSKSYSLNEYHHIVGTGSFASGRVRIYINGELGCENTFSTGLSPKEYGTLSWYIGAATNNTADTAYGFPIDGQLDEVAIWSTELDGNDVKVLYERQKQKYAGHYDSSIIELGTSKDLTTLSALSTLPFFKDLPTQNGSESSTSYSSLVGTTGSTNDDDLLTGLSGYWPFRKDRLDYSGNGNHVDNYSGTDTYNISNIGSIHTVNDANRYTRVDHKASIATPNDYFTFSSWIKTTEADIKDSSVYVFSKYRYDAPVNRGWMISEITASKKARLRVFVDNGAGGTNDISLDSNSDVLDGNLHHIAFTFAKNEADPTNSELKLYVDGKLDNSTTYNFNTLGVLDSNYHLEFLSYDSQGQFGQAATWSRALSATEIKQLYQRYSNRLKYQVRVCDDSACDTETFQGPDGTTGTYFSEYLNNDAIDGSNNPTGNVKSVAPEFALADFSVGNQTNRYWQYRAYFEAEQNSACDNMACMPELKQISLGPNSSYVEATASIVTKEAIKVSGTITSITEDKSGSCTPTYQFSVDGTNFYYHNGSKWALVASDNDANTIDDVKANIGKLATSGASLYMKAFLTSDGSQQCDLKEVSFSVSDQD